jgi:hypothetical protein
MRCGYCQASGVDIDHVRQKKCDTTGAEKFADSGLSPVTKPPQWPASVPQKDYVLGLQDERVLPEHWVRWTRDDLDMLERDEVSAQISLLKSFTKRERSSTRKAWTMPAGRYALRHRVTGEWWFFQIDRPTDGRWKGYVFIKRLIGSPGDYQKVDMKPVDRKLWLDLIEVEQQQALADYGKQTVTCGICHSALTVKASRERGIGPKCFAKLGW